MDPQNQVPWIDFSSRYLYQAMTFSKPYHIATRNFFNKNIEFQSSYDYN